jgi:hypothetical protein
LKLFLANLHSPFFLEKKIDKFYLFSFNTSELMKIMFINWMFHIYFFLNRKPHIPSLMYFRSFLYQTKFSMQNFRLSS